MPGLGFLVLAVSVSVILGGAGAMAATSCPGAPLFSDYFRTLDRAWGAADATVRIERNMLVFTAAAGKPAGRMNTGLHLKDFAMCAEAAVASAADGNDPGGLIFWVADARDYYTFTINGEGYFAVFRTVNRNTMAVLNWQRTPLLKTGAGVWNALQITAIGKAATFLINGEEVARITGEPPAAGGLIGFLADASAKGPAVWAFAGLVITNPDVSPPPPPPPVAPPRVSAAPPARTAPQPPRQQAASNPPAPVRRRPSPVPGGGNEDRPRQQVVRYFGPGVGEQAIPMKIPSGSGGFLYVADGSPAISVGLVRGGQPQVAPTKCTLYGARLISLAIDGTGDIFAGTSDGRVLACVHGAGPAGAGAGAILSFRAGDAAAPLSDTYVATGVTGDLYLVLGKPIDAPSAPPEIAHYAALGPNGAPTLLGIIKGPSTGLTDPQGIAIASGGKIVVLDRINGQSRVLEFAANASGNATPVALIGNTTGIVGDNTSLVDSTAIATDASGRLYVANASNDLQGHYDPRTATITVYDPAANGNAHPVAVIRGPATGLAQPGNLAIDGAGDIWVGMPTLPHGMRAGAEIYAVGSNLNVMPIGAFTTGSIEPAIAIYPAASIGMLAPAP